MTDTPRSRSTLLSMFADGQGIAAITPQDARDLIVSFQPPCGGFYIADGDAVGTPIPVAGAFVKASGITTITALDRMTMPMNNRLAYIGVPDRHFHLVAIMSFTSLGVNDNVCVAIAKNGIVIDHSILTRFMAAGIDQGTSSCHADINLSTNDYVEIFVTNKDDTKDFTLEQAYMFGLGTIV